MSRIVMSYKLLVMGRTTITTTTIFQEFKTLGRFVLFLALLLSTQPIFSQNWTLFKKNDSIDCRFFTTDPLRNVYVITNKSEVIKYDNQGYFDSRYSNKKYGRLAAVDATNSFKLLFWYPDFQSIMLVDAALNELKTLNLNDLQVGRAAAMAMGDDGNLWILDGTSNQMVQFGVEQSNVKKVQSTPLSMSGLQPTQMVVRQNLFYLNVPSRGILVFDRFGKLVRTLAITNASFFQILDNQVFYQKDNQFFRFHLQTLASSPIVLPKDVKGAQPIRLEKGRLFAQRGTSVDIFDQK
jgi:hypothetical protein